MIKTKVTWEDISKFNRGATKEDRELLIKREWKPSPYISMPNGRSYFLAECPFCKYEQQIYTWSFAGSGKRCEVCGAMFSWFREAYQFKEFVELKLALK